MTILLWKGQKKVAIKRSLRLLRRALRYRTRAQMQIDSHDVSTLASEDIDGHVLTTHYETLNRGYSSPNLISLDLKKRAYRMMHAESLCQAAQ